MCLSPASMHQNGTREGARTLFVLFLCLLRAWSSHKRSKSVGQTSEWIDAIMKRFRKRKSWLTLPKETKLVFREEWFSRQILKGKHFTVEGPQRQRKQHGDPHKASNSLGHSWSADWQARQESDRGGLIRTQVGLWSNGKLWQVIALGGWKGRDVRPGEETAPVTFFSLLCGQREQMRQQHLDQQ